jgi:hypothetical protein
MFGPLAEAETVSCPGAPSPTRKPTTIRPQPGLVIQVTVAKDERQAQAVATVPSETGFMSPNDALDLRVEHSLGPNGLYRFYACDR